MRNMSYLPGLAYLCGFCENMYHTMLISATVFSNICPGLSVVAFLHSNDWMDEHTVFP